MDKHNHVRIGTIKGIPLNLDYSWFIVFILITWILAGSYFPSQYKNWTSFSYWSIGAFTSILFFISVLLHELAHSALAIHYKLKVKKITLFIFGGIAEISEEPKKPMQEFWIASAGPIASFIIALLSYIIAKVFSGNEQFHAMFQYLFEINFILAIFNLVPGFPLDGGRVFRAIIWAFTKDYKKATKISAATGKFFGFFFILLGFFILMKGDVIDGIWIAFVGWFLETASVAQVQRQVISELLKGHTVQDAMSRSFALLPYDTTIQEFIENDLLVRHKRFFIVERDGNNIGFLTLHTIQNVPKDAWNTTTVSEIMIPLSKLKTLKSNDDLVGAIKEMDNEGVNQLPVFEDNEIIGILSRENIITYLSRMHKDGQ